MLYAHHTVPLKPQEAGSVQPANQHSGFEPVPLIAGLAEALWVAEVERVETVARTLQLRNTLIHRILETVPEAALTGHPTQRLPNHASFALKGLNGDAILHDLNKVGIAAGGGSASASGKQEPSHVLTAMRIPPNRIKGQVRFVLGRDSTHQQVEHLLSHLEAIIARQRAARDNA
jgi:cysteine desulfurase